MFFWGIQNPLYVIWAFSFQLMLAAFFAVRRRNFDLAAKRGWIVYALSLVGLLVSMQQIHRGESWSFWIGGFVYLVWGVFGLLVDYALNLTWRAPIAWKVFIPYTALYLVTVMFYWWPLAEIDRRLWYGGAFLFVIGSSLNLASHSVKATNQKA